MLKRFHLIAKISLVCVYLIIVAGAVVRMTGSGMGCPDWPKCFGYYIPPTSESDIEFKSSHEYKAGHVIKINDYFYYAKNDFKSTETLKNTVKHHNPSSIHASRATASWRAGPSTARARTRRSSWTAGSWSRSSASRWPACAAAPGLLQGNPFRVETPLKYTKNYQNALTYTI